MLDPTQRHTPSVRTLSVCFRETGRELDPSSVAANESLPSSGRTDVEACGRSYYLKPLFLFADGT